jgi:tripeptide aminopeptidase
MQIETNNTHTERLLNTFLDLVRIDNPSGQETDVVQYIRRTLEPLGLSFEQDEHLNLVARLPGEGEPLLINAHTDCVAPCVGVRPVVEDGIIRSSGDTVLGADDLAGVAAILEGVRRVRESGGTHRAAELLFTSQEEIGLRGAAVFDYSRLQASMGVTLDSTGAIGGMCMGGPSQDSLIAVILGKAAHAGLEPEAGINAIRVAAEAIAAMPLGRIDAETTANVGVIQGGAATNIIPERAELHGEARSHNQASLDAQIEAMSRALNEAAERHGATLELTISHPYRTYRLKDDEPVVQYVMTTFKRLDIEPYTYISGGGSDVNIFAQHGIRVVNVSLGYQAIHTLNEHMAVADLERAAQFVTALLTEAAE